MVYKRSRDLILLGVLFIALFVWIGFLAMHEGGLVQNIDYFVASFFDTIRLPLLTEIVVLITRIGDGEFLIHGAGILALALAVYKRFDLALGALAGVAIMSALTSEAKDYFGRSRPEDMIIMTRGWSYPSGHATGAFVFFIMLAWVCISSIKNRFWKITTATLSIVIAIAVGMSRVYLNVHWFSDVYGGALFALGISLILIGTLNALHYCVTCKWGK